MRDFAIIQKKLNFAAPVYMIEDFEVILTC